MSEVIENDKTSGLNTEEYETTQGAAANRRDRRKSSACVVAPSATKGTKRNGLAEEASGNPCREGAR